ncbi:MAG TPA: ChaN family lipoprotein [Firmicutes bacterium]|jgi:hypothetical protein|nr:ChaN family lipoprotein [Bacillota bacterium]
MVLGVSILAGIILLVFYPQKKLALPIIDQSMRAELEAYIIEHYKTPEEYIIDKFMDHDIIFLGEYHRIKHDVELVHDLIPLLYKNGIYNLGIEFACYEDQDKIDLLITADEYDQSLAYAIQFNFWPYWGYQEYIDIYKDAWELNQKIPEGVKKFRIVGLNSKQDWRYLKTEEDRNNPEIMGKIMKDGPGDQFMAEVIIEEFIDKGEKALIYCGINHGYTKYKQPYFYHDNDQQLVGLFNDRMGNIIYEKIGEKCLTIFLHSPWPSRDDLSEFVYPVEGIIDSLMLNMDEKYKPVGFDVNGTPFENLPGNSSFWQHGYNDFNLSIYCDGYIYMKPLSEYRGVEVAPGFINEENRIEAIHQSTNPNNKNFNRTVADLIEGIKNDANIQKRFKKFR